MKPDRLPGCDVGLLRGGYEQLRRDALDNSEAECMKAKGLVLVLRHGMLAWLQAWSEYTVAGGETEKDNEEPDRYLMPEDIRYQTAVLLATMALHVRREVRPI